MDSELFDRLSDEAAGTVVDSYLSCSPLQYPNLNVSLFVYGQLGERCVTPAIIAPTVVIYGSILVLGIFGNVCTCLVIAKNKSMQSVPTNYYLFSLAVSDLLMLILGLPMELYGVFDVLYPYRFGEFICKSRAFLVEFTSYASILTITCFSVERWLAICFVYESLTFSTLERALRVIVLVWVCAFMAALPVAFMVVLNRLPVPDFVHTLAEPLSDFSGDNITLLGTDYCAMDFQRPDMQRTFIYATFLVFFLLPALLITFVYGHMAYSCSSRGPVVADGTKKKLQTRNSILKMLFAVVVMFFICWLPFHIQRLLTVFLNDAQMSEENSIDTSSTTVQALFNVIFYISGYCYYMNGILNPLIYNILSEKYRLAFSKTILGERLTHKLWSDDRCYSGRFRQLNTTIQQHRKASPSEGFPLRSGHLSHTPPCTLCATTPDGRRTCQLQRSFYRHDRGRRCGMVGGALHCGEASRLRPLIKSRSTASNFSNDWETSSLQHHRLSPVVLARNSSTNRKPTSINANGAAHSQLLCGPHRKFTIGGGDIHYTPIVTTTPAHGEDDCKPHAAKKTTTTYGRLDPCRRTDNSSPVSIGSDVPQPL